MKPHINSIKIATFAFLLFFTLTTYSQEEESENITNQNTSKVLPKEIEKNDDSKLLDVKANDKNIPVLSKAIKELNKKIETVIIENKMLTMRNSALISGIDQD